MLALSWRCACLVTFAIMALSVRADLPPDKDNRARQPTQEQLDRQEALKLYTKALLQKSEHRYLESIHTLEAARGLDPKAAAVHRQLGALHQLLDHETDAVASFQKAVELDPDDGDAWFHCAQLQRLQSRPKEAAEALSRGTKAASLVEQPAVRYAMFLELGDVWEELKEPSKAADAFDAAWSILSKPEQLLVHAAIEPEQVLPRSAELLERVGRNAAAAKQFDRALAAFGKAGEVYPECKPRVALNLAGVYVAQEEYEKALKAVNLYLDSKPLGTEGYERKITILRKLKRDVVEALEGHLAKDRDNIPLKLLYARELASAGKLQAAEAQYASLATDAPDAEVYRGLFAVYLRTSGGDVRILNELDEALKAISAKDDKGEPVPADAHAVAQAHAMLDALRDDPKAVKAVLQAASDKLGTAELVLKTRLSLAALADHTKQLDLAERLYRSCLQNDSPHGRRDEQDIYYGLLRILWREHKHQAIVDVCESGLKNARRINRVVLYDDMARALNALGKTDEALKQADKAVAAAGAMSS